jgi:hypothetical protein
VSSGRVCHLFRDPGRQGILRPVSVVFLDSRKNCRSENIYQSLADGIYNEISGLMNTKSGHQIGARCTPTVFSLRRSCRAISRPDLPSTISSRTSSSRLVSSRSRASFGENSGDNCGSNTSSPVATRLIADPKSKSTAFLRMYPRAPALIAWRTRLSSECVVGEAGDGVEAVRKASAFKPGVDFGRMVGYPETAFATPDRGTLTIWVGSTAERGFQRFRTSNAIGFSENEPNL